MVRHQKDGGVPPAGHQLTLQSEGSHYLVAQGDKIHQMNGGIKYKFYTIGRKQSDPRRCGGIIN